MDETSRFIGPLLKWLLPDALPETLRSIHGVIRKLAHVTEYSILAALAWNALRGWSGRPFLAAFLLTATVAVIDELDQAFSGSRTGSLYDVLLDTASGGLVLAAIYFVAKRARTTK